MPILHTQQQQQLPPLKGHRQGPISDPQFLNQKKPQLQQQPAKTNLHDVELCEESLQQRDGGAGNDDPLLEVDFESG